MNRTWFKIVSWHASAGWESRGGLEKLLCGRWARVGAETSDTLPPGKSCETCLRKVARQDEAGGG